jgi:TPR repeat protein
MIERLAIACLLAACVHDLGPERPRPSSIGACDQTWEPTACLDAGHYFVSQHDFERAVVMYDRGCKRQLMDACIAGSRYSLELAVAACDMGYEPACMDAARYLDGDLPRRKALLERVCKREPQRCAEAAQILVDRDEPSALALVRHACGLPDQREACRASVRVRFRTQANLLEVSRLGCAIDIAEACLRAGHLVKAPEEKRELLMRSCKLKLPEGCIALGRLISKP